MATHVALMREGRIEQFGPPAELLANPATAFVVRFMGTPPANLLDGPDGRRMYRAESLRLVPGGTDGAITTTYAETTPLAGRFVVTGTPAGSRALCRHPSGSVPGAGRPGRPGQPDGRRGRRRPPRLRLNLTPTAPDTDPTG